MFRSVYLLEACLHVGGDPGYKDGVNHFAGVK